MKNNQRKAIKRKLKKKELLEKLKDDELYRLARLGTDTWEGQVQLPINEICPEKKKNDWLFGWF